VRGCCTNVIHGNADLIVPVDDGRAMADTCPDAAF